MASPLNTHCNLPTRPPAILECVYASTSHTFNDAYFWQLYALTGMNIIFDFILEMLRFVWDNRPENIQTWRNYFLVIISQSMLGFAISLSIPSLLQWVIRSTNYDELWWLQQHLWSALCTIWLKNEESFKTVIKYLLKVIPLNLEAVIIWDHMS